MRDELKSKVVEDYNNAIVELDGTVPEDVQELINQFKRMKYKLDEFGNVETGAEILFAIQLVLVLATIGFAIFQLVTAPKPPNVPNATQSSGFTLENTFDTTLPIPIVYGRVKQAGQYFFQTMQNLKTDNLLNIGIGLSEGPIESVTDIRVNDLSLDNLRDQFDDGKLLKEEVFLGDISNPSPENGGVSSIFNTPGNVQDFNNLIDPKTAIPLIVTTQGNRVVRLDFGLVWPGGNFNVNDEDGKFRAFPFKMQVDYRVAGTDAWIPALTINESIKNRGAFRRQFFIADGLLPNRYDVRFTNNSGFNERDPTTNDVNLDFLSEGLSLDEAPFEVGDFAYLALQMRATPTIGTSSKPLITNITKGLKVDVYVDPDVPPVKKWSDNPAWCILDLLLNPRYGLGNIFTLDNIDLQSFIDTAAFLEITDINGARNGRVNININQSIAALDMLLTLATTGSVFFQDIDGKLGIFADKMEFPIRVVDDSEILEDSFSMIIESSQVSSNVNQLNVNFMDETNDYTTGVVRIEDLSGVSTGADIIEREVDLTGVTNPLDVEKWGRRAFNQMRTNIRTVTFSLDFKSVDFLVGDVIALNKPLVGFENKPFRILNIEENADSSRNITALEHNNSVYEVGVSNITARPPTNAFNPLLVPSGVVNVQLNPEFTRLGSGQIQTNLDISWDFPTDGGQSLGLDRFDLFADILIPEKELPVGTPFNENDPNSIFQLTASGTVLSGTVGFPTSFAGSASKENRSFGLTDIGQNVFVHIQISPVTIAGIPRPKESIPINSLFFPTFSGQPSNSDIFTAVLVGNGVQLNWSSLPQSEAPSLAGFEIRTVDQDFGVDDDNLVFKGLAQSFLDTNITSRSKGYFLRAFNQNNLFSAASKFAQFSSNPPVPVIPLGSITTGNNIEIQWQKSPESQVVGYEVHVSGTSGFTPDNQSLFQVIPDPNITTTTFVDNELIDNNFIARFVKIAARDSLTPVVMDPQFSTELTISGVFTENSMTGEGVINPEIQLEFDTETVIDDTEIFIPVEPNSIVSLNYDIAGRLAFEIGAFAEIQVRIQREVSPGVWLQLQTIGLNIRITSDLVTEETNLGPFSPVNNFSGNYRLQDDMPMISGVARYRVVVKQITIFGGTGTVFINGFNLIVNQGTAR